MKSLTADENLLSNRGGQVLVGVSGQDNHASLVHPKGRQYDMMRWLTKSETLV